MLKPEDIAAIFEWIELLLIASLKRNLAHHKEEEEQEGFTWSAWQAEKLRSINTFRRQSKAIMDRYTDVIDSETRQLLEEQFEEGVNGAAKELEEARAEKAAPAALPAAEEQQTPAENPEQGHSETSKKSSVEKVTAEPAVVAEVTPEPQFFGVDKSKTEKLIEDVTNIEKQAETAALRLTDDVYRQTVNRVQLAMATGSISYAKAVDMAVADFLAQGINCIEYKDGRRVNIADYVRMVLRTTSTRAALQGESESWKARGYDTVQVSSYGMCSKTCLPWQGRAYINDAFTDWSGETKLENGIKYGKSNYCGKWFPLLSSAIEHGLFHPNCRHGLGLHIEGVTALPEPMDNSEIERRYKEEQELRAKEREVRKAKRKVEGSLAPEDVKKAKAELAEAQKNVRDHINKTNAAEGDTVLVRKPLQEKIYGGDVRIGSDADPVYGPKSPPESVPEGYAVDVDVAAPKQSAPAQYTEEKIPERFKSAEEEKPTEVQQPPVEDVNNSSIDNSEKSGTINVEVDEFVPCLKDAETGEIVETEVREISDKSILSECTEENGWAFPWNTPPENYDIYSLNVKNSNIIEGLIALKPDEKYWGVHMFWGNSAPHNLGKNKKYIGVGGHLFAIAAKVSIDNGYGGFIFADAANKELFDMFIEKYGATPYSTVNRPYRFAFEEDALRRILETYNFDWGDEDG